MNSCVGGCINGPAIDNKEEKASYFKRKLDMEAAIERIPADFPPVDDAVVIHKAFVNRASREEMPSEQQIRKPLQK